MIYRGLPSGKLTWPWKITMLWMGKLTISMVMFNSYMWNYQRVTGLTWWKTIPWWCRITNEQPSTVFFILPHQKSMKNHPKPSIFMVTQHFLFKKPTWFQVVVTCNLRLFQGFADLSQDQQFLSGGQDLSGLLIWFHGHSIRLIWAFQDISPISIVEAWAETSRANDPLDMAIVIQWFFFT